MSKRNLARPFTIDRGGWYHFTKKVRPRDIIDIALTIVGRKFRRRTALTNPGHAKEYLTLKLGSLEHEVFMAIFLDNRHRIIKVERLFNGTIDGTSVYPREVVKKALKYNAAAIIFCHNHPSGVCEQSQADEVITKKLANALALVDIRVLDHLLLAGDEVMSFAERGLL